MEHSDLFLQGSAKGLWQGLVNFVPAVAYRFCLNWPAASEAFLPSPVYLISSKVQYEKKKSARRNECIQALSTDSSQAWVAQWLRDVGRTSSLENRHELIFVLSTRLHIPTHSHRTPDFHLKLPLSSHLLLLDAVERKQPRMKPTSPEVMSTSRCLAESLVEGEDSIRDNLD